MAECSVSSFRLRFKMVDSLTVTRFIIYITLGVGSATNLIRPMNINMGLYQKAGQKLILWFRYHR